MAQIHYSLSGEGRGHAARARVLVDLLRERHNIVLHAYGAGLDLLRPLHEQGIAEVREIPGLRFTYDEHGTLDKGRSLLNSLPFVRAMHQRAKQLAKTLERERADLVISDFEPLLPRAAELAGIRAMSVDHQQFLTAYDLSCLPPQALLKAQALAPFVGPYYRNLSRAVVSAFFFPPLRHTPHPVTQTGVLLRREVLEAEVQTGDHLVAYVRRQAPKEVLNALANCGCNVRVYGHEQTGTAGTLSFHSIDSGAFARDLASSRGLVSSAGNQVVGEALSLKKPVLAYPEPGNFEQSINAFFLHSGGQGWSERARHFTPNLIRAFLDHIPSLKSAIKTERQNGNRRTLAAVEQEISAASVPTPKETRAFEWPFRARRHLGEELARQW